MNSFLAEIFNLKLFKAAQVKNDLEFYNREAPRWWNPSADIYALNQMNPLRFDYFDRYVSQWEGVRVLDVGCGGGYTCDYLARRGAIAAGIDQSQLCIQAAKAHAEAMHRVIDYHCGEASSLPFEDGAFDVVTCLDALEHIADWQGAIAEIARVLKPGGLFLFDTINRTLQSNLVMIWLLERILQKIPQGVHDWEMFITPTELAQVMQTHGFHTINIHGLNLFGRTPLEYIRSFFHYQKTKSFRSSIDEDLSVMYIGCAIAPKE